MKREASVKGAFYPESCVDVEYLMEQFDDILNKALANSDVLAIKPRAIISPHAGYVYSGLTASIAHRVLANSNPKRVIVIGPSHRVYLNGISGSFYDRYETPCGDLEIDREYLEALKEKFDIEFIPEAHHEHSTEVQMPFIKHYINDPKVVELVYGDINPINLSKICEYILNDKQNVIVISTDLSHYHSQKEANQLDSICLKGVEDLDIALLKSCEACGIIGVEAIVMAAKKMGLVSRILDYRTSADASGDESSVVGYMSVAFLNQ